MGKVIILLTICVFLFHCKGEMDQGRTEPLFILKDNKSVGIQFENRLIDTNEFNVYKYRNFYNGGGVAIGDINNDGLQDVYMVSNQNDNNLFLNKGNWKFENITLRSGTAGKRAWSTGVTMVDINADGFLDIYVCNSGDIKGDNKENELFINNGNLTFTESAAAYGLNDEGLSTHASFFDYDKDGDLDCYILNNSFKSIGSFNLRINERSKRDKMGGDKLMQNQNGKFVDVSEKAGIYGSVIGFGLGITVGDVNNDGWEDIYVSNDFFERDYLYINQQNGTFREDLVNQIQATSAASMGADIADIDNDGYNDIFVTDMLPKEYSRLKTVTTFDDWDRYQLGVDNGYHHQFTRNTLQHNNGNGTFSEISRFAGVEASDWSWGALFFDMDNDGFKDLFIANGIYRDLTDQDYLQYISSEEVMSSVIKKEGVDYKKLIDIIPSRPVANQAHKNMGENRFSDFPESGLQTKGFSNGSAYADLDNDGDLDLIVNNINMPCFIYENTASQTNKNSYLKLELRGVNKNIRAIGASIRATDENGSIYFYENQPTRGFESSMDPRTNIGLGKAKMVDLEIKWPSGTVTNMSNVKVNQTLIISEKEGKNISQTSSQVGARLYLMPNTFTFNHTENAYADFNRERLNYHFMSTRGPIVAYGDINGDALADLVIPGPKGVPSTIYTQSRDGKYTLFSSPSFDLSKEAEKIETHLFDADKDGDLDLYVASGGVELTEYSDLLHDQLWINDGKGNFSNSGQQLPTTEVKVSTGTVASADIDRDGDIDLFVGERVKIGNYGAKCSGYLLTNDGKGVFTDQTNNRCPGLIDMGMITDAVFCDMNGDKQLDLVVVGEFMDVSIFLNKDGKFGKVNIGSGISGWWNVVKAVDIDNDGDNDLILGNHGLNSRFKADEKKPITLYFNDFDDNGAPEGILSKTYADGKIFPYPLRHNLMARMPILKKKFPNFDSFKNATMDEILPKEKISSATKCLVDELRSLILVNDGNMKFTKKILPTSVQYSPIYAISATDIDGDGFQDLLMGGNLYGVQPEMGRYDASYGHLLINDRKGSFSDKSKEFGFSVTGEIRDFVIQGNRIIVFRNNASALVYQIKK